MANVYREDSQSLHTILDKASTAAGATLLIPDLQRPYVWKPNQVTLLIDSLIRGWPFGTLLLWKVRHEELQWIPFRPFWQTVDRTDDAAGAQAAQMNPPAEYHMVLDGQQRVQSLLLGLGGDDWGFKLEDRDWIEALKNRRPRGRQSKNPHWSKASLCFDLDAFLGEYQRGGNLLSVDFNNVLIWAIVDPSNGQSSYHKPDNYEEPLVNSTLPQNKGRYIRLSRLWREAQPNPGLKEAHFRNIVEPVLKHHDVPDNKIAALLPPLGELMTTLRDVKMADVTYLELQPFDDTTWTRDSYNDAIVNIFTRLNTAGRTLTREEITLAWLKVGWDSNATGGNTAGECFQEILFELAERNLNIHMDDLVAGVSMVWAVAYNDGKPLENRDLLRGEVIRPMASSISGCWEDICRAVLDITDRVNDRGLAYGSGNHYASLNALSLLWAWYYLALSWERAQSLTVPQKDAFEKKCLETLDKYVDRWLICSQWAGRWSESSGRVVGGYAKALNEDVQRLKATKAYEEAHTALEARLDTFVKGLEEDASQYITNLSATSRDRVVIYRNALWIWHRLDLQRWNMSQIQLRIGKKKTSLDVDHMVAHSLWEKKISSGLPTGITDHDEAMLIVNRLGNCSLLEKTFNISKSDKSLKSFLLQVHEFKENTVNLPSWQKALVVSDNLLDPTPATADAIAEALDARDKAIRGQVIEFIKGQRARVDL
jgi:hypothetical protein